MVVLTAGRCVQGAAAAAAVLSAVRLLTTVADGARGPGPRAVAAWSAAGAAAGASGFVVGGLVSAVTTWRVHLLGAALGHGRRAGGGDRSPGPA